MNWTSEHGTLFVEGGDDGMELVESDPANETTIFGHSGLINNPNCTGCLNELCIAEADYEVYRFAPSSFLSPLLLLRALTGDQLPRPCRTQGDRLAQCRRT